MPIISKVITANEAVKISAQFIDVEHEYVINVMLTDIKKYAMEGRNFFYYDRQLVNEWFWEDITSYYCLNYLRRLGYQTLIEPHRYKINDEVMMIRW